MDSSRLFQLHKDRPKAEFSGTCHDCGLPVDVVSEKTPEGKISISGGAVYEAPGGVFFKCGACFDADKALKNHRECEVYSRVVGYLRPVSQWNTGKIAEFDRRALLRFH